MWAGISAAIFPPWYLKTKADSQRRPAQRGWAILGPGNTVGPAPGTGNTLEFVSAWTNKSSFLLWKRNELKENLRERAWPHRLRAERTACRKERGGAMGRWKEGKNRIHSLEDQRALPEAWLMPSKPRHLLPRLGTIPLASASSTFLGDPLRSTTAEQVSVLYHPSLLQVWASWCGLCPEMTPVSERLSRDGGGGGKEEFQLPGPYGPSCHWPQPQPTRSLWVGILPKIPSTSSWKGLLSANLGASMTAPCSSCNFSFLSSCHRQPQMHTSRIKWSLLALSVASFLLKDLLICYPQASASPFGVRQAGYESYHKNFTAANGRRPTNSVSLNKVD